jgi:hypothetical protein
MLASEEYSATAGTGDCNTVTGGLLEPGDEAILVRSVIALRCITSSGFSAETDGATVFAGSQDVLVEDQ